MTQKEQVYRYMQDKGSISTMEAFKIGITRLSARIYDLKEDGVQIISERVFYKADDGKHKHYDRFRLAGGGGNG